MMLSLILLNAVIFFLLGLLHIYWALGGSWGVPYVIPIDNTGKLVFKPGSLMTFVVAVTLFLFAAVDLFFLDLPILSDRRDFAISYGVLIIGVIFILRAIGDFRYVGFSKKHKNNTFAKLDYWFYSPLCLSIAIVQVWSFLI